MVGPIFYFLILTLVKLYDGAFPEQRNPTAILQTVKGVEENNYTHDQPAECSTSYWATLSKEYSTQLSMQVPAHKTPNPQDSKHYIPLSSPQARHTGNRLPARLKKAEVPFWRFYSISLSHLLSRPPPIQFEGFPKKLTCRVPHDSIFKNDLDEWEPLGPIQSYIEVLSSDTFEDASKNPSIHSMDKFYLAGE